MLLYKPAFYYSRNSFTPAAPNAELHPEASALLGQGSFPPALLPEPQHKAGLGQTLGTQGKGDRNQAGPKTR